MAFEDEILKSRAGKIDRLCYVIFENIAKYVGADEVILQEIVQELIELSDKFRTQPSDELRCKYQMLYYRLAILGYPLMLPPEAQLPVAEMPEPIDVMIARRNRALKEIYDESIVVPEPSPEPTVRKRLTWDDMLSAQDLEELLNDEKETRTFGNNSVEIYQLNRELYRFADNWRKTKQVIFLYSYHIILYKLVILGFDPYDMEFMAEIAEPSEIPAYYWHSHKE